MLCAIKDCVWSPLQHSLRPPLTKHRIYLFLVLSLVSAGIARAETDFEQRVRLSHEKDPGSSLVFMHARLMEESSRAPICQQIWVDLLSDKDKKFSVKVQDTPTLFGRVLSGATYGGAIMLPAGKYAVLSVSCEGAAGTKLLGEFARFRVGSDEIVNVGSIFIDFTRGSFKLVGKITFTGRTSVEDMGEQAKASLAERSPVIFPKATKRYMISNPATSGNASTGESSRSAAPAPKRDD